MSPARLAPGAGPPARARAGDLLALGAGAVLPLAFAPFGLFPLALLAPAALFAAWLGVTPRRALWRGWLFGLGQFGVGVSWVVHSFQFSHVALPLAVALTAGFVAGMALYPALLGYGVARLAPRDAPVALALVMPGAWVLAEWLRGWFLTGFPWLDLGYSQIDSPLAGLAPVVGVRGLSLCVALGAGALALAWHRRGRAPVALAVALVPWVAGAALLGTVWTEPAGAPRSVALVQGNVPQAIKWRAEQRAPTLERYLGLSRPHWGAELVVWPETALPGMHSVFREFLADVGAEAATAGSALLVGVPRAEGEPPRYFNSVALVGPPERFYDKRHLVPFGEYVPLRALIGGLLDLMRLPMSQFSAGAESQPPLVAAGVTLGISVCYEIAFGEEVRRALPGAGMLLTVSNDAWFGDSIAPHQHLEIARMRALETGRWVLRATNTGITALVDEGGAVRARLPQFETAVLAGEARAMAGATPYVRLGPLPVLALAAAMVLAGLPRARPPRRG